MDQQTETKQTEPVEAADAAPSGESRETESSFSMNTLLRRAAGLIGLGSEDPDDRETAIPGATGEDAETVTLTKAELEDRINRESQSRKDKEIARLRREQEQADTSSRSAVEWERVKTLAKEGDVWALGEIAKKEVEDREKAEADSAQFADTFLKTAPTWDATYLDPLLGKLPEDVWKPIVGEGLTTLDDRQKAVEKAIEAHRTAAVAEALTDEKFVKDLLGSQSFRSAWLKSDVVRKQFMATVRGSDDYEEPDWTPGVDRSHLAGNENEDMNARLRGQGLSVVQTRPTRRRERGNRDLNE